MLIRKYEMPWRAASEAYAGTVWLAAMVAFFYLDSQGVAPWPVLRCLSALCLVAALLRWYQAIRILVVRASLSGHAMQIITTDRLRQYCEQADDRVFLGFGFAWQPVHSQRLYELAKINYRDVLVSPWILRLLGYQSDPQPDAEIGMPYIHGVEPKEGPLYRPLLNFEGGTCIAGTTQSGKGVALSVLVSQAVYRGDVVIIFDPKNSKRLKGAVMKACADTRAPDTFLDFHPAFPERGVRLDPMFNWQKPTELASRIQSIMPPDTSGSFSSFGWDAVNVVVQGLVEIEDRPNLAKLTQYIEGSIEPVLEASLIRFFDAHMGTGWRDSDELRRYRQAAERGHMKRPSETATSDLMAYVSYYEKHVPKADRTKVIDSQVRTFRHNREHYQKITANLVPILSMLTSGDLGRSLSPDPFDPDDERPIMNLEKVVRGGHVLYFALDSLPDPGVASAIAAIFLADLAAFAGMRYNLNLNRTRIALFVDEVANVINQPLIEILNKGAESGIYTTCAMQTLADLAKRLGSEEAARMALGNLNNLIALRSKDRPTQDFIVETFGKTAIHTLKVGLNTAADAHLGDFTSVYSQQVSESFEEMVPAEVLGKLPNLQYFASVSGGRLIKGRFPIIDWETGARGER
ncbi:conjugative transfer system coupling protein TraD [Actimicrobium sp. CCI2.3]|uniref:conjugative transfer system coupling protein TraD n=1 Tax=Actimicrobium sp. CCI2.3 TaxID=3048616 RepID=UPI002AB555E4|nr:conjugative transfer system coupling protein TraD [Actimicrobium sp. CCI2.3]MDY7574431.1 conjugative transfer system coupling protein TraD [Actimicrobium sp. CCI2.3]MEB0022491.1 conjugative transfer system coupling protein TraD [Actimicrobium sp. CCI2.3]